MALTQISTAGVKDDAVTAGKIPANAVGSSELADNAVDTAAIADDAVTATKLASNAVVTDSIVAANITTAKIANDAVTENQLASNAVVTASIQDSNVTTAKIADQAVTLAKLPHGDSNNNGKFLRANNGADPSFETVSIPAGTTINNNADNRVITGSGTANTLEGEATFTHNPSTYDTTIIHNANAPSDLIIQNDSSGTAANARLTIQSGSNANAGAMLQFVTGSDNWSLLTPKTAGALDFNDNGTLAFKMAGSGNFDVITGDVTINGSGKGIDFAQGANTGTAANILDDYEEGDWTPAFENLSNTPSYYNLAGKYTKVGRLVTIWGMIQIGATQPTFSSNNSVLHIAGLPFANNATTGYLGGAGPVTHQSWNVFGNTYNDYGANGTVTCGVANSTRTVFAVNPSTNGGIRGQARRKSFEGGPIVTWTMQYQTTA